MDDCPHLTYFGLRTQIFSYIYNSMRHCDGCGRDYENEWEMGQETELRPKMWG